MVRERERCWGAVLSKLSCVSMFTTIARLTPQKHLCYCSTLEQDSVSMILLLEWSGHTHVQNVPHTFTYYIRHKHLWTQHVKWSYSFIPRHPKAPFWGCHACRVPGECSAFLVSGAIQLNSSSALKIGGVLDYIDRHPHSYKEHLSQTHGDTKPK